MKTFFKYLFLMICILSCPQIFAQVAINTTGAVANTNAMLDISSNTKGVLLPRLSSAQRLAIPSPKTGLMVFDSTTASFWFAQSGKWSELATGSSSSDSTIIYGGGAVISNNMVNNAVYTSLSGYLYDSGGPAGNYGNNENSSVLINPTDPNSLNVIRIQVLSNNLENPYDSLFITNGLDSYVLTGTQTFSGLLFATGIQIRFKSNNVNTAPGFQIRWDLILAPPASPNDAPLTGWYYIPQKLAMAGGLNTANNWSADSTGQFSLSWGLSNKAPGLNSLSIGTLNSATNNYSMALGFYNMSSGLRSVALNGYNKATNADALAIGNATTASGFDAFSSGLQTTASGNQSSSFGGNTNAVGGYAAAFGYATNANGTSSFAGGQNTTASGDNSTSFGDNNLVSGTSSLVSGSFNRALGNYSLVAGYKDTADFIGAFVIGQKNRVSGYNAMAGGESSQGYGDDALAFGRNTLAYGNYSFAGGYRDTAEGDGSFSIGQFNHALGDYSVAVGENNRVSGKDAASFGSASSAFGNYSFTTGFGSTAGDYSFATGFNSTAGNNAFAFGSGAKANASQSFAGGINSATGSFADNSIAVGLQTFANGFCSAALGRQTYAGGPYSSAFGFFTRATGLNSSALGNNTIAKGFATTALGTYNDSLLLTDQNTVISTTPLVIIGNGDNNTSRSNAMVILKNGNTGIGNITPQQNLSVAAGLNIDQSSANNGTITNTLTFGGSSGEGIGSKRTAGGNNSGLDLYTAGTQRLSITNSGNVGIGNITPQQNLSVNAGMDIDQASANNGTITNTLTFGGGSGEGIGSKRTATGNTNGLDLYTANTARMSINNNGNVGIGITTASQKLEVNGNAAVDGNLTVGASNFGIIRNSNSTQMKLVSTNVIVNPGGGIGAGATINIPVTFSQAFSSAPLVYIGSCNGSGGWAEAVMTTTASSTAGCTLWIFNPRGIAVTPNFTVSIIAIGAP